MTDLRTLFRTIDDLTDDEKRQVMAYLQGTQPNHPTSSQPRVFDLHAGVIWVSVDFDDELPEAFWLGDS